MASYSFSQVGLYNQCPKKYQFRYLDKVETEFVSSPDLILWTSVHWTLEWLYKQINVFITPTKEETLAKFHELWDGWIKEAGEWLMYKWDQTASDYIRRWEHYIDSYYDKYAPFEWIKLVWTELQLTFQLKEDWEEEWRPFRWFVDRLDKEWEDTFVINDYKTNIYLPPEQKEDYREQLTLYALWVKEKYGKYLKKIKAKLHYLHFDICDEWEVTDDLIQPIKERYEKAIDEIENKKEQYEHNPNDKNIFPTKANSFCQYCEFSNLCPLFLHLNQEDEVLDGGVLWETTVKRLVDEYAKLSKQISQETKEKDTIKEVLIEYADSKWYEQLFGNENNMKISKSGNYSMKDKTKLKEYLIEKWVFNEVWDVSWGKINWLVEDWTIDDETAKELLEYKDSYRVSISKKKEEKKEEE